jgi:hypothetical protein
LHKKIANRTFSTYGILLAPARSILVGTHTRTMPPCGPVAIGTRPAWQRLNIATSGLTASAGCYCDISVKINMARLHFTSIHKKILSTESSPSDPPCAHNSVLVGSHTCTNRRAHMGRVVSARRTVELNGVRHLRSSHTAMDL